MIYSLTLENIAIVDRLHVEFQQGFTVITGEAGSGKSLLVDAIGWAFGEPGSYKDLIRTGQKLARVELVASLPTQKEMAQQLAALLQEWEVELEPEATAMVLYREFTPSGSRARINGCPVKLQSLQALRPFCVDIQGQHALTGLFKRSFQRACLDSLGGAPVKALKAKISKAYASWQTLKKELEEKQIAIDSLEQQRDFITFQLEELDKANLSDSAEDSRCRETLNRLSHSESLIKSLSDAGYLLSGSGGESWGGHESSPTVESILLKVQKRIAEANRMDPMAIQPFFEKLFTIIEDARELGGELTAYRETLECSPEEMNQLVERLDQLERLKRKYGPSLAEVMSTQQRLQTELETLLNTEENMEKLQTAFSEAEMLLTGSSQQLSQERHHLAQMFEAKIVRLLQQLGMPHANFHVHFETTPYSPEGMDEVEFQFSANPGEPVRPVAKTASGGEMARILLALSAITEPASDHHTLLLDEIDTGTSGSTAKAIADLLVRLTHQQGYQILIITHQPIIAAAADDHLWISKKVSLKTLEDNTSVASTSVDAEFLETKEKRLELLSRLASGIENLPSSLEGFIKALVEQAELFKEKVIEAQKPKKVSSRR